LKCNEIKKKEGMECQSLNPYSYFKKKVKFVPVEDGFITSDGKNKKDTHIITINPSIQFYKIPIKK
jgi:hypothetical protein